MARDIGASPDWERAMLLGSLGIGRRMTAVALAASHLMRGVGDAV